MNLDAPSEAEAAKFWLRQARWTAVRQNAGHWLAAFLPFSIGVSVVFAGALLILRQNGGALREAWICFGAALLLAGVAAFFTSRRRFLSSRDGLVRLELTLGLHNRLSSAHAGIGTYPAPQPVQDGLSWRWQKIAVPLAVCALSVLGAALVPLAQQTQAAVAIEQPLAWTQVESWVEQLQEQDTIEQQSLEEIREKLDDLRAQDREQWYSHSSLEASENLRQQTEQSLQTMSRDLSAAAAALAALEQLQEQLDGPASKQMQEALKKAMQGLESGNLQLDKELLAQLKDLDLSKLKQLSPEQLAALKRRLKEGAKVCKACLKPGDGEEDPDALIAILQTGGISRGPGTVPLASSEKPTELNSETTEAVSNDDLSRALPGDVLGVGKGEHEIDRNAFSGPVAAGRIKSSGEGGEAVWRNDVTPRERRSWSAFSSEVHRASVAFAAARLNSAVSSPHEPVRHGSESAERGEKAAEAACRD
jgi:signal transduction histidine kinase